MFSRLSKYSVQCFLLHCSILSMYRRRTSLTLFVAASATSSPLRLTLVNRFGAALNEKRSVLSSSVHYRLAYGDGRALATCLSKTCRRPWQYRVRLASALSSVGRRIGSAAGATCTPSRTSCARRRTPGTSGCLCSCIHPDGDLSSR
jgi:hypothetical protein